MTSVTIFATDPAVEGMEPFVHDKQHFHFRHLTPHGSPYLADGPLWAFLDWVLGDISGLELCRRLRADPRTKNAHVTIVLEEDNPDNGRRALNAGADDYMVGPVSRQRILDRVLAIDPNLRPHASTRLAIGDISINKLAYSARWAGKTLPLPPNEFRLLCFLAENPDRVLTRSEIIAGLGKGDHLDARTVDVWIGRLRRALQDAGAGAQNPLRTVRSQGYVFQTP